MNRVDRVLFVLNDKIYEIHQGGCRLDCQLWHMEECCGCGGDCGIAKMCRVSAVALGTVNTGWFVQEVQV